MSKPIKVILIIALVFLCLGLVMSAVLLPSALRKGVFGNTDHKGYQYNESLPSTQIDIQGVETIVLDIDYSKVDIVTTAGDKIIADVSYTGKKRFDFYYEKQGSKLLIRHRWDNGKSFWLNNDRSDIALQIPSSFTGNYEYKLNAIDLEAKAIKANNVKVEVNAGKAVFDGLVCNSIDTDLNAGDVHYLNSSVQNLKIENDAGRTIFDGRANVVDSVINMGSIDCTLSVLPSSMKANINAGNMNVRLPSNSVFEVNSNINAGTLNNEFKDSYSAGFMSRDDGSVQAGTVVPVFKVEVNAGGMSFYRN